MKHTTSAILCTPMLALASCTVGPDYTATEPSDLTPDEWSAHAGTEAPVDLTIWWAQLGDEELSALIERAFAGSLTLAEARERVIAARARRGIANADRLPMLDAEALYARSETGDEGFTLGEGAPPGSGTDLYSLGAIAGWELDLWGRVARLVEEADADIEFAIEDVRATRVVLAAEVAREVVAIRAIDLDIRLVESTIEADRDAVDIARARADAGFGDELDVARATRVLDANAALLPLLRADRREAEFRLATLLGVPPGEVSVTRSDLPARDVVPQRGVPADLLLRRPDLRRAEREVAATTARIGAEKAERYPRVLLSGSIALQGPDIGDAVNPEAYILRFGPTITLPIFEGGRIRSRVQQAESEQRQAMLRLRSAVISALAEVETATMRRARVEQRVEHLRAAETAAIDAENLSVDRYTAGRVDFLDVTEARRARLAIERDRVAAERDATLRLIDLYAALGGGWGSADDELVSSR